MNEHMDLGSEEIKSKIKQGYKIYLRLKKDTGRHEAWIGQLMPKVRMSPKNLSGNACGAQRRFATMPG